VREGEAKASRESKESKEGSRVRGSIERGEHGRSEANREEASLLRGEARSSGTSGAGELLCSVTSGRSSESEGCCSPSGTESEGSGEGSGLANRRGEGYFVAVSGATEAKPDGACEQSEGGSESANRAEHESQSERARRSLASEETIGRKEREVRASPPLCHNPSQSAVSSSRSQRKASIVAVGSHLASSSRRKGRPEEERPSSSARSRRRAR
jgi:hypothetical protein